ncbi:N-acetyl-gamma-glutamyl-phosphate reductase [Novosphingopyxis iocasae]|uniref:N-acetyl-gamma-glutamyl-phosphate reductase n=1 Tax=Novosphingopyxis iocasae TaxID=2762729 RepID=UPI00165163F5|nr:N-acetyl-gamma-glutamyl-phosphate reductase [Novosphingopyxis iocasae]
MNTVFIDGAAGTTGLEIRERLSGRAAFEVIVLEDERRKDVAARRDAIASADVTILCLPDDAARDAVSLGGPDSRFIDASSVHRTDPAWTYGFAELNSGQRAAIENARLVSNPGCYPTGFLALVAPLVAQGLLPADWPYSVNAVSGYSGGGKALIERYEQAEAPAFRAYGLTLEHKHLPEMKAHAGLAETPIFAPAVVPGFRGMLVEVPLPLAAMGAKGRAEDLAEVLAEHYDGERLVTVKQTDGIGEMLIAKDQAPSDRLDLYVFSSGDGGQARLIAMLDNLGKGASGAAVQNLNLMTGQPETEGLRL